jgi:parvulin-like peptidyl-prolyl isomerase
MAMIQKIRDNSALTFIVVGGALLAFVLTDSIGGSGQSDNAENMVGSFEGKEISIGEFDNHRRTISLLQNPVKKFESFNDKENDKSVSDSWQMLLNEKFVLEETKKLGIAISEDELEEMMVGERASGFYVNYLFGGQQEFIKNRNTIKDDIANYYEFAKIAYKDPRTGQVNPLALNPTSAQTIKQFGVQLRVQDKYNNLIKNCFYSTTSLLKDAYVAKETKKDFQVAFIKYATLNDSTVVPTEQEVQASYDELKESFKNKETETRKLVFASFPIQPSAEDRSVVLDEVAQIKIELLDTSYKTTEETKFNTFKYESDLGNYSKYFKKSEYPIKVGGIDTVLFSLKKGEAFGPFSNPGNSQFGVAQVLGSKFMADSARISLIEISDKPWSDKYLKGLAPGEKPSEPVIKKLQKEYKAGVDSLLAIVKSNPNALNSIPQKYWVDSIDWSKRSDRNWIYSESPKYGVNVADSVFLSISGDVKICYSQRGFACIVNVKKFGKKVKKIQIGSIIKKVTPLDNTLDSYKKKATTLAFELSSGKDIDVLRDSLYYFVDSTSIKGSTFTLNGVSGAREIIHWGLSAELNKPSQVFTTPERYIVAVVTKIENSSYKTLNDAGVKYQCEADARKKKQRVQLLASLPDVSTENISNFPNLVKNGQVTKSSNESISKSSPIYSNEGKVIGKIAGLEKGKISEVIEGKDGLYIVYVSNVVKTEVTEDTNYQIEKDKFKQDGEQSSYRIVQEFIDEKLDIVDNRKILQ